MLFQKTKIPTSLLTQLAIQWQLLTATRIPLDQAFGLLSDGFKNDNKLYRRLCIIRKHLQQGSSLYESFRQHTPYFPDLFIQLIQAGERSGDLAKTLGHAATYFEKNEQLKKKLIQTLTYPIITIVIALVVILFMLFIVIPSFAEIYKTTNTNVPYFTQILVDLSFFLISYSHLLLSGILAISVFLYLFKKYTRNILIKFVLVIPVLNEYIRLSFQSRFSYSMHVLLSNSIPMLDALKISGEISKWQQYKQEINFLLHITRKGEFFSAIKMNGLIFSPILMTMMKTGEQTAHLDTIFKQLSSYYQKQIEFRTSSLLAIMEPAIILILGLIIGAIVVALYIPMFEISSGLGS